MTREITYPDGRTRKPKYIDHGHHARKAVYWTVFALLLPVGLLELGLMFIVQGLDWLGGHVNDLRVWSHPCLYAGSRPPKREQDGQVKLDGWE